MSHSDDHPDGHKADKKHATKFEDPVEEKIFWFIGKLQEYSIPLLLGVFLSLVVANISPHTYFFYFNNGVILRTDDQSIGSEDLQVHFEPDAPGHRMLGGGGGDTARWTIPFCHHADSLFMGHPFSIKFFANDIIMVFFFAHAAKGLTESLLPGGSLNPIKKAVNPLLATCGGVVGPILVFTLLLEIFYAGGAFPPEKTYAELYNGWGIVTATDIPIAWMVARFVFGDGHPAIDYLLLLAIVDDAIGLVIIAAFYPDPLHPVEPQWLILVLLGMFLAYLLRKWHYRCPRKHNQGWVPYLFFGGLPAWIGLMKARLHPALALVFIVPFMPGPEAHALQKIEEHGSSKLKDEVMANVHRGTVDITPAQAAAAMAQTATSGKEIGHGMMASIVGNKIDPSLKVTVTDEDGNEHHSASTLDSFEHDIHVWVDFGMFLFSFCNAGVEITGIGALTWLIFLSLVIGKTIGIFVMYKVGLVLGYPAPLGVRQHHILMAGFIGGIGLTVALFVADAAYQDPVLQGDAKLGALFSGIVGFVAIGVGQCIDYKNFSVAHDATGQIAKFVNSENAKAAKKAGANANSDNNPLHARDAMSIDRAADDNAAAGTI